MGNRVKSDEPGAVAPAALVPPSGPAARAVYAEILRFGPRPRTELAHRLDLSGPTLTRASRALLDAGLLRELPPIMRDKGRPQEPLDVDDERARFIGVKITADGVFASVTTARGVVHEDLEEPLADTRPTTVLRTARRLARTLLAAHPRVAGVGVSLPGIVHDGRRAMSSHLLGWSSPTDVGGDLAGALEVPVTVDNDFTALLRGMAWSGIGRRYRSFGVVTVGAGAAVGTVLDGAVLPGAHHRAGLTEAMPVVTADGTRTTFGDATRTAVVVERARAHGAIRDGEGLPALIAAARDGQAPALTVAREVAGVVADVVASLVALTDPEAVVLGGETAELLTLPAVDIASRVRALVPASQADLELRSISGDFDEWARGAASIAVRRFVTGA